MDQPLSGQLMWARSPLSQQGFVGQNMFLWSNQTQRMVSFICCKVDSCVTPMYDPLFNCRVWGTIFDQRNKMAQRDNKKFKVLLNTTPKVNCWKVKYQKGVGHLKSLVGHLTSNLVGHLKISHVYNPWICSWHLFWSPWKTVLTYWKNIAIKNCNLLNRFFLHFDIKGIRQNSNKKWEVEILSLRM